MIFNLLNFAANRPCPPNGFLGLEPWYQYIDNTQHFNGCTVTHFNLLGSDLVLVLLAIIDDLLRIAGLVAIAFVFYGAIQFITSQGNPEQTKTARNTVINALIGLAIASIAIVFVGYLGSSIGS